MWCLTYSKLYGGLIVKVFFLILPCFWYIYKTGCWPVWSLSQQLSSDIKALMRVVLAWGGWTASIADTSSDKVPPRLKLLRFVTRAPSLVGFLISVTAVCANAVRASSISSYSMESLEKLPDYSRGCLRWMWWWQSFRDVQEIENDPVGV